MSTCAFCEEEIEDEAELATADCGHEFHSYCLEPMQQNNMPCRECDPAYYEVADEPVENTTAVTEYPDEVLPEATSLPQPEVVDEPVEQLGITVPVEETVTATPETTDTATTTGETTATGTTDEDERDEAADELVEAMGEAKSAYTAANDALSALVSAKGSRKVIAAQLEEASPGWESAFGACAQTSAWDAYAKDMKTWPANAETTNEVRVAAESFRDNAKVLTAAQPVLDAMVIVDLGAGVFDTLSAQGEENVADMACTGTGYTGHNLHALTDDLKGWLSIRAEEGFVVIVRWQGERLQVGATGKHIQTSNGYDYKLDAKPASSFVPGLAWRDASGGTHLALA